MGKLQLVGQRFGKLEVLAAHGCDRHQKTLWLCRCACGELTVVVGSNLRKGNSTQCKQCANTIGARSLKHGRTGSAEYYSWAAMIQRCTNPNDKSYPNYGGRGISVCRRWFKFENFLADMGSRPADTFLERKNNAQGYSKRNCVWASRREQNLNRRNARYFQGKRVHEWAEILGLSYKTTISRLNRRGTVFLPGGNDGLIG